MFLTIDELETLTGYRLPKLQIKWLSDRAWCFEVAGNGKPVVARAYANHRLGAPAVQPVDWQPDFSDLHAE